MGQLTGLMATLKGLPSTYNKDLQEDKEPLFDAVDSLERLAADRLRRAVDADGQPAAMRAALVPEMLATDLAEYLVRKGVPFREAHHVAGAAVQMAELQGVPLSELDLEDLQTLHGAFDDDVADVWSFERSVERRDVDGGSSQRSVLAQIARLRTWLAGG